MGAPELTTPALDRGVGDRGDRDRGLLPANPDREDVGDAADDETASALGCDRIPSFGPADVLTDGEIGRLLAMTQLYSLPGLDGTPCLFRMARSLQDSLFAVARRQPRSYRKCLERLLDMYTVLRSRTERPYKLLFDTSLRRPLPPEVLDYWPFSEHEQWAADLRAVKKGRAVVLEPIPLVAKQERIDADEARQAQLEAALLRLERTLVGLSLTGTGLAGTPRVKAAITTLSTLTLKHIERQTGVRFNTPFAGDKLIKHTECLIYHSVYPVVLDNRGEPTTLPGLHYPILVPDPGSDMEQHLHPPGLYVSVQKYGFGDYRLEDDRITKILFGGIGGLLENYGLGVREPHQFQRTIQAYLDAKGPPAYVASIVAPAAFQPRELTVDTVERKLPELAAATIPYMVTEITKQARDLYENWEEVAEAVGVEALKAVITRKVRDEVVEYLVKKIGVKIVPLVNAADALYDLFTGEEERRRVRNIIGCILLHVKGIGQDDLHVAAKTLAQILAERFKDALLDALTEKAAAGSVKLLKRRKGRPGKGEDPQRTPRQSAPPAGQGTPARTSDRPPPNQPAASRTATEHPSTGARATDATAVGNPGTEHIGTRPARTLEPPVPPQVREQETAREDPREAEPEATSGAKRSKEREGEEEAAREKVAKKGQRPKSTGREAEGEEPAAKTRRRKPGTARETEGQEEASGSRGPQPPAPTKQPDPNSEVRGTADPGTAGTGTAEDQADAQRARAREKRQRLRKIKLVYRLRQRWGPAATVILQAIKRSKTLRQAWSKVAEDLYAHHLVPVEVLKSNEVAQAAVVGGYDFNGKINGVLLTFPEHYGGHAEYNDLVSEEMDTWAREEKGGRYTPQEARQFVEKKLVSKWREEYLHSGER